MEVPARWSSEGRIGLSLTDVWRRRAAVEEDSRTESENSSRRSARAAREERAAWEAAKELDVTKRKKRFDEEEELRVAEIGRLAAWLKGRDDAAADVALFVDNCYGEFVEETEPCAVGADLVAGSLIKNPGGTLAPSGGYVAGRAALDFLGDRVAALEVVGAEVV